MQFDALRPPVSENETAGSGEGRASWCGQELVSVVLLWAVASAMSRGALCSILVARDLVK